MTEVHSKKTQVSPAEAEEEKPKVKNQLRILGSTKWRIYCMVLHSMNILMAIGYTYVLMTGLMRSVGWTENKTDTLEATTTASTTAQSTTGKWKKRKDKYLMMAYAVCAGLAIAIACFGLCKPSVKLLYLYMMIMGVILVLDCFVIFTYLAVALDVVIMFFTFLAIKELSGAQE